MARLERDLTAGDVVGIYRVEAPLGRGGMGAVYMAEHVHLRRRVALKVLPAGLAEDPDFRERFVRESQLAASIDHPNVIPVYDANDQGGVLYLAMRYVEGSDLKSVLSRELRLDPARTLDIFTQVAAGLDAAHARGLVHRDVKPANVLLEDGTKQVFVTDFGIAKLAAATGITRTGSFVGTIEYASPEQFEGKPLDRRSDVYSLGCLMFHCLAGEPPYVRDSDAAVMHAHLMEPPPSLTDVRPELPSALNTVIAKAMAKEPADRYPTAGAAAHALAAALGQPGAAVTEVESSSAVSTVAAGATLAEPEIRPTRRTGTRHMRLYTAVVLALVAAGIVAALVVLNDGGGTASGNRAAALRLPIGGSLTMTLTVKKHGEQQIAHVAVTRGQRLLLSWSRNTLADYTGITVVAPNGSEIASTGFYGRHGQLDPVDLHASGIYELQFNPAAKSTGTVALKLRNVPPDSRGLLRPGVPLTLTISAIGQRAIASFAAKANQRALIGYSRNTIPGFTGITLLSPSGSQVRSSSTGFYVVRGTLKPVQLTTTGVYELQLEPEATATGSVTLTLTLEGTHG